MDRPVITGEAFSAGLGFALGLAMAGCMLQAFRFSRLLVREVIVCLKCGGKNSIKNRFCWHCGEALYPPPSIKCPKCCLPMPRDMKFCWRCGSPLKEGGIIKGEG
ncbi:MAG: zinc ribbon domain-containing protein [Candidatus Bathyarchaeia archaeon]